MGKTIGIWIELDQPLILILCHVGVFGLEPEGHSVNILILWSRDQVEANGTMPWREVRL